jgi:hypothetical protein
MSELLTPPAVPLAILNFFSNQPDFLALEGDISEEFHQRAQTTGAKAANRWYFREVLRNAWALTARELFRSPALTTLVAFGCLEAVDAFIALYAFMRYFPLPTLEIFYAQRHRLESFVFIFIASLAIGWISGRLLRGREWALALTYSLISTLFVLYWLWQRLSTLPMSLTEWFLAESALRQIAFGIGTLWIRKSSSVALRGRAG